MSAVTSDNVAFLRAAEKPVHCLLVGASLQSASGLFQRKVEAVRCEHIADYSAGLDLIVSQAKQRPFDCVMVDMRQTQNEDPDFIQNLATLGAFGQLVILANKKNCGQYEAISGVGTVLVDPIQPIDIVKTIVASVQDPQILQDDNATATDTSDDTLASPSLAPTMSDLTDTMERSAQDSVESVKETSSGSAWWAVQDAAIDLKTKLEPSLAKLGAVDQGLWKRFVPLVSFFYKKLAIVLLSALFLTFVAYGAMIIFFMTNDNWSMPFQLSRGHVLVEKVERDLSSLSLRRNQLRQDLTSAMAELENAGRAKRDGQLQLLLSQRTVDQEIKSISAARSEAMDQIGRLQKIGADFKKLSGKKSLSNNLKGSFEKRLITKSAFNRGRLALLETMHRLAVVEGEISSRRLEVRRHDDSLAFLNALQVEIGRAEIESVPAGNSELAHLAREVIQAKTQIASASTAQSSTKLRTDQLELSFGVISSNLQSLQKTPAARALEAPVTVLFVPYDNVDNVEEGQPLYSCALTIIVCSQVGQVGQVIMGESASVHPLFGKPMRGVFVEAQFDEAQSSNTEMVHSGSAPLWF